MYVAVIGIGCSLCVRIGGCRHLSVVVRQVCGVGIMSNVILIVRFTSRIRAKFQVTVRVIVSQSEGLGF